MDTNLTNPIDGLEKFKSYWDSGRGFRAATNDHDIRVMAKLFLDLHGTAPELIIVSDLIIQGIPTLFVGPVPLDSVLPLDHNVPPGPARDRQDPPEQTETAKPYIDAMNLENAPLGDPAQLSFAF